MRREIITHRFGGAAQRGRRDGAEAGREAAKAILNLTAGAVALLALVPVLITLAVLMGAVAYVLVGLLVVIVFLVASYWLVFFAFSVVFLITVVYRLFRSPALNPDHVTETHETIPGDIDAAADRLAAWRPTSPDYASCG